MRYLRHICRSIVSFCTFFYGRCVDVFVFCSQSEKLVCYRYGYFVKLFCNQSYKYRGRDCSLAHALKFMQEYKRKYCGDNYKRAVAHYLHITEFYFGEKFAQRKCKPFARKSYYVCRDFKTYAYGNKHYARNAYKPLRPIFLRGYSFCNR